MISRTTLSDLLSSLLRRWQHRPAPAATAAPAAPPARRRVVGELGPLHTYLADRYADTVILTFEQIEAINGAPLPPAARRDGTWWVPGAAARHTDAWTLAQRKATVNLQARLASFERVAL
jgi:hypothetical protein